MKPDWKDAPEWAQWLAQDDDGEWYWYENKPHQVEDGWYAKGRTMSAGTTDNVSREERPQ